MTPNEYQKEALRTASGMSKEYPRTILLMVASLGISVSIRRALIPAV